MCQQAEAQVLNVAKTAESTVITLLAESKLITTAEGQTITTDFTTLITDIQNWKSGTPATDAIQVVEDIEAVLPALPIPAPFNILVPIALGGLTTILTLLGANSPAPATPETTAAVAAAPALAAHIQTLHASAVAAAGEAKVTSLTGYKPSVMDKARAMMGDTHVAANKYKQTWNTTVSDNGLPETLKAA